MDSPLILLPLAFVVWLLIAPALALARASSARRLAEDNRRRLDELLARRENAGDGTPESIRDIRVVTKPSVTPAPVRMPASVPAETTSPPPVPVKPLADEPPPLPKKVRETPVEAPELRIAPPPLPERPVEPATPFNWEMFLGAKLFAWIGGLAFFIGVSFLLKYSMEHGWVTPAMRAAGGFTLGLGLIAGAFRFDRERYAVLRESLCATGILVLYAVTYACRSLWHLEVFTQPVSFATMSAITVGAFIVAVRTDAKTVAVLGLAGGVLTPVLLATGIDNPYGLFGYIALIDIGLLAVALRKHWNFLPPLAAVGTIFIQTGWWLGFWQKGDYASTDAIFIPMAAFALFAWLFAGACLIARRRGAVSEGLSVSSIAMLLPAYVAGFAFVFAERLVERPQISFAYVLLVELAAIAIAVADKRKSFLIPVAGGLVFVLLSLWTSDALNASTLVAGLGVQFAFGLLHTGVPMLLKKTGRIASIPPVAQCVPVLTMVLLLGAASVSRGLADIPVVAALLGASALGLALAVTGRKLIGFAVCLPAAFIAVAILMTHVSSSETLFPWLVTLAAVAAFFIGAGVLTSRMFPSQKPIAERPWDEALAALMPAASALMPFFLLTAVPMRVPLSSPLPVYAFAAAMTGVLLLLARTMPAGILAPAALAGTWLVEVSWQSSSITPANAPEALLWTLGFAALFTLYPFLCRKTFADRSSPWIGAAVALIIHFLLVEAQMRCAWTQAWTPGLIPLLFAVPAFGATYASSRIPGKSHTTRLAWFAGTGLLFVTVAIALRFDRETLTLALALEGLALTALARKVVHRGLVVTGVALLGIAFVRLALNPAVLSYHIRGERPLLNWYLYAYPLVALSLSAAARLIPTECPVFGPRTSPALKAMSVALFFLLLNLEIADAFSAPGTRVLVFEFSGNLARDMSYSLGWGLFALVMLIAGIVKKRRSARITGIALLSVTLLKVFLHDLANLDDLYRIGAFIGVAIIAGFASFLYQRFRSA